MKRLAAMGVILWAAPVGASPADITMVDDECVTSSASLHSRRVTSGPGTRAVAKCSHDRGANAFRCETRWPADPRAGVRTINYSVADMDLPIMTWVDNDSLMFVFFNWETRRYVLSHTMLNKAAGVVVRKQCIGTWTGPHGL